MIRVGAIVVVVSALFAAPAAASPNGGPGTAPVVALNTPFAGTWAGTPASHPAVNGGVSYPTQWWRVAPFVRTGDQLQVAIDNSQNATSLAVCLVQPTDEFGADSALPSCQKRQRIIPAGRLDRIGLALSGPSGNPLLVFYGGQPTQAGGYTAVVERVLTLVKIGTARPLGTIKRKFTYRAFVTYGDGTRAKNGTRGFLQWRRPNRNSAGPASFTTFATAKSAKGRLRFKAKLPRTAGSRVQLRSCVAQPEGGVRCGGTEKVKLRKDTTSGGTTPR